MSGSSKHSTVNYKPLYSVMDNGDPLVQLIRNHKPISKIHESEHYCSILMSNGKVIRFWCSNLWYAFARLGSISELYETGKFKTISWEEDMLPKNEFMKLAHYYKNIPVTDGLERARILEGHKCSKCGSEDMFFLIHSHDGSSDYVMCDGCKEEHNYSMTNSICFLDRGTVELKSK